MTDHRCDEPHAFVPFLTGPDLPDDLIDRLCEVLCPPLFATVELPTFVRLIGASHSLNALEKWRIFDQLPTLSQYQIDALQEVMEDETTQFAKLVPTEWDVVASLSARSWLHLCLVADHLGAGYADEMAERKALALMLQHKYHGESRQLWVTRAKDMCPLGEHVFSAMAKPVPHLPLSEFF